MMCKYQSHHGNAHVVYHKNVILKRLPNGTYVYIIGVIKLRTIGSVEHVTLVEQKRHAYRNLVENLKERNHSEKLGVDGRIILKQTLNKYDGRS